KVPPMVPFLRPIQSAGRTPLFGSTRIERNKPRTAPVMVARGFGAPRCRSLLCNRKQGFPMKTAIATALTVALMTSAAVAGHAPKATKFNMVPLVSDQAGVAPNTDPDLVNPWGLSYQPGGPAWVSDQGTSLSTLYD